MGSIRARPWKSRGCNKESCTLGKLSICVLQGPCSVYPQMGRAHTMSNANNRTWHPFFKVVDHSQEVT